MSHEMYSFNQAGKEVGYIRFTMNDPNAVFLYMLLDAESYNAGVSGNGKLTIISLNQMKKALDTFKALIDRDFSSTKERVLHWREKEILEFITCTLKVAQKDGEVKVAFA